MVKWLIISNFSKRIRDASIYTSKKISLKFLFLSDIFFDVYILASRIRLQAIPFGLYSWCDPQFTCGFARVIECVHHEKEKSLLMAGKWGIIDTLGNVIVPFKYDKIWALKEEYLFSVKAFINEKEERLNLHELATNVIFDGLTYIKIYSAEEFKDLTNCNRILVKQCQDSGILYFTYGANIGYVYLNSIPKEPVISIVVNSSGKIGTVA